MSEKAFLVDQLMSPGTILLSHSLTLLTNGIRYVKGEERSSVLTTRLKVLETWKDVKLYPGTRELKSASIDKLVLDKN